MDGKPLQLLTPDGRPMVYRAEASLQPEFEDFRDSFQGSLAAGGADGDLMGGSFGGANMMMEKKNNNNYNNYNNNMTMNSTITSSINPLADAQQLDADGRPLTYRAGPSLQPDFEDFRDSFQGTCNSSIDDMLGDDGMSSFHGSMGGGSGGAGSNPLHGGGGIARRAPPSNLPQMTAKDWARIRNARDPTSGGKQAIGRAGELLGTVPQEAEVGNEEEGEEDGDADEPGVLL